MEEDEIGMRNALGQAHGHTQYVQCARCGKLIAERDAFAVPADAFEEAADFHLLCSSCRDALDDGEQELPLASE